MLRIRRLKKISLALVAAIGLSGCATWDTSNVRANAAYTATDEMLTPQDVKLTSATFDPTSYQKIQDLRVSVNKTTAFHPEPTPEQVKQKLQEEAAKLGATEVFDVTISGVKITPLSWGTREGTGMAARPR